MPGASSGEMEDATATVSSVVAHILDVATVSHTPIIFGAKPRLMHMDMNFLRIPLAIQSGVFSAQPQATHCRGGQKALCSCTKNRRKTEL